MAKKPTSKTPSVPAVDRAAHGSPSVVTCVYCGHEYPEGTPTHKATLLTEHIKVCDKHPMRQAEERIKRLHKALAALVGAETEDELKQLELGIRMTPAPEEDRAAMIDAIHALLSEANNASQAAPTQTKQNNE